jgi:hypothetical protein
MPRQNQRSHHRSKRFFRSLQSNVVGKVFRMMPARSDIVTAWDVILCAPESVPSEVIGVEGLIGRDTGASAHVRNTELGAIKIDEKEKNSVMASMTVMKTLQIGDFLLEFFDKKKVTRPWVDAINSPGGVQDECFTGWKMIGHKDVMWLTARDETKTLMFAIVI